MVSNLVITAVLEGRRIDAVVDTAAQVTVVSLDWIRENRPSVRMGEKISLLNAAKGSTMEGWRLAAQKFSCGGTEFLVDVIVAPIVDNMLLGLDFLKRNRIVIDLGDLTVLVNGKLVPALGKKTGDQQYDVGRAALTRKVVVPPYTERQVLVDSPCKGGKTFIFESSGKNKGVLVPRVAVNADGSFPVLIRNDSPKYISFRKGHLLGYLTEVEECWEEDFVPNLRSVKTESGSASPCAKKLPVHLEDVFQWSSGHLNIDEKASLFKLLEEFQDVFASGDLDIGLCSSIKHHINTGDAPPFKERMRRTPLGFQAEEEKHLQAMLDADVIQPSSSPWSSAPVLVRKKGGGLRWCVDFRRLNNLTVKDAFPLPRIEECLDFLGETLYLSTLDMASGYWQVEIAEEDRPKTAFITKYGLFEHKRMGFGLCNAPATFQRVVQLVLSGLTWKQALAYLDDIIIVGRNFNEHLENLRAVLLRFREHNLKLQPKKCALFQQSVKILGKLVTPEGVAVDPGKIEMVRDWSTPKSVREVEAFLGFVNYHRAHIKGYAELSAPLYELTGALARKKSFVWAEEHTVAFQKLREALTTAPVLGLPKEDGLFILDTDASDSQVGAVLQQVQEGKEVVISYGSFVLTPAQRRYCTTRKELLSIVRFTRQFRHYLLGRQFLIRTDHNSLTWLLKFKNIEGQLARWMEELSQFDMVIQHRPGKNHQNADGLSRLPDNLPFCDCYEAGSTVQDLPCGGCKFCERAHEQWSRFENDVDDVLPLAVRAVSSGMTQSLDGDIMDPVVSVNTVAVDLSAENFKKEQSKDPDFAVVLRWLQDHSEPTVLELSLASPAVKYYWQHRQQLQLKDGVLYYRWQDPSQDVWKLVVPATLRDGVMSSLHDDPLAGHLGQRNTTLLVKGRYIWFNLSADCKRFVSSCARCNISKKPNRRPRAALGGYHAGMPMERVHVDILGPFRPSRQGNVYILMIIDQFTKWLECIPIPDQTAETVAKAVVDDFIARMGCPLEIHTDQGRQFEGNLFLAVCQLLQISKTRTTPYHPSSNGQVERYNRQLLQMIRCFLSQGQDDWDLYLPQLAGAIRSTVNRQTGFSANNMMLGREVWKPLDIMAGVASGSSRSKSPESYVN